MRVILGSVRVLVTLVVLAIAVVAGAVLWDYYVYSPWTRDGRVRAEVVGIAPEVAGRITALHVADNQFVRKGDLLFSIDPASYRLNVAQAEAVVENRAQDLRLREAQANRRARLNDLSVSAEEKETYAINAAIAGSALRQAQVAADIARLDLARTELRAPVNGWVTNLQLRAGDYATTGRNAFSIVDADAFWVSGYFEETKLARIRDGARATIRLMGEDRPITGRVNSFARGITDPNATPGGEGLATVNPNFTWVRLAQRIPVRIQLDTIPPGMRLSAGMTCTITVDEEGRPAPSVFGQRLPVSWPGVTTAR